MSRHVQWGGPPKEPPSPSKRPSEQKVRLLDKIRTLQLAEGTLPMLQEQIGALERDNAELKAELEATRGELVASRDALRKGLDIARAKGAKMEALMRNIVSERNKSQTALERALGDLKELRGYVMEVEEERDVLRVSLLHNQEVSKPSSSRAQQQPTRTPSPRRRHQDGGVHATSSLEDLASESSPPPPYTSSPRQPTMALHPDFEALSVFNVATQTTGDRSQEELAGADTTAHLIVAALVTNRDRPLATIRSVGTLPYMRYMRGDGRSSWYHAPDTRREITPVDTPTPQETTSHLVRSFVTDPDIRRVLLGGHIHINGRERSNPLGMSLRPDERSHLYRGNSAAVFLAAIVGAPLPSWEPWCGVEQALIQAVTVNKDVVVLKAKSGMEGIVTGTSMLAKDNVVQVTTCEAGHDGVINTASSWIPAGFLSQHFSHYCVVSPRDGSRTHPNSMELRLSSSILPIDGMLEVGIVVCFGEEENARDSSGSDDEFSAQHLHKRRAAISMEFERNADTITSAISAHVFGAWDRLSVFPSVRQISVDSSDCCVVFKSSELTEVAALPHAPKEVTLVVDLGTLYHEGSGLRALSFVAVPPSGGTSRSELSGSPLRAESGDWAAEGGWAAQDWAPASPHLHQEEIERDEWRSDHRHSHSPRAIAQVLPRVVSVQIDGQDWLLSEVDVDTLRSMRKEDGSREDDRSSIGADTLASSRVSRRGSLRGRGHFRPVRPMRFTTDSVAAPFVSRFLKWVSGAMLVTERYMIAMSEAYSTAAASQSQLCFSLTTLDAYHERQSELYITYVDRKHRLFSSECHWRSEALVHQASVYARRSQDWALRLAGLLSDHASSAMSLFMESFPEELAISVLRPDYADADTLAVYDRSNHVADWALATAQIAGDWAVEQSRMAGAELEAIVGGLSKYHGSALLRYRTHREETDGLYLRYEELEQELGLSLARISERDEEIRMLSMELRQAGVAAVELQSANQQMRRRFAREMTIRDDVIAKAKQQISKAHTSGVVEFDDIPWPDGDTPLVDDTPPATGATRCNRAPPVSVRPDPIPFASPMRGTTAAHTKQFSVTAKGLRYISDKDARVNAVDEERSRQLQQASANVAKIRQVGKSPAAPRVQGGGYAARHANRL